MEQHYFERLTQLLKQHGTGLPQLLVDKARFFHNLEVIKSQLHYQVYPRLVVKSLANIELLEMASRYLETDRFMLFHLPQLREILRVFPESNVLMGKPMPMKAVERFYQLYPEFNAANIQWLVDSNARLEQYLEFAKRSHLKLKINVEIDVGLHRGGLQSEQDFVKIMNCLQQSQVYLTFSGLMGYDAHVAKLPKWLKKIQEAFGESQDLYRHYQEIILKKFPELWSEQLCFNGGGSPTLSLHLHKTVCNDVAFGSVLLKPSDFDLLTLSAFKPALWIATPVLKVLSKAEIPAMEMLSKLPIKRQAIFIYGGYWLANYVYPYGLKPHVLYGRSSNQEMLTLAQNQVIKVDDYVIARPTQSEAVIVQFKELYLLDQQQCVVLQNLRE